MKKALSILAIALAIGLTGFQLANAGPGRGWGPGNCNGPCASTETSEKWQAFKDDNTAELRQQLREKRHDYFDLMNSDNVDKDAAQKLWSDMFDLKAQIKEKAATAGVELPARGFGRHGWRDHRCNGPRGIGYSADGPDDMPCPGPGNCPNLQ